VDKLAEDVRTLLAERIESISELETLLLLHRTEPIEWDARQLATELRIEVRAADHHLAALTARELLAYSEVDGEVRYRFAPATEAIARAVSGLAAAYEKRRVAVVQAVYSRPTDTIRVFADAFRLRKGPDDR
jgi:predicted ArsR family transcriptional regulator